MIIAKYDVGLCSAVYAEIRPAISLYTFRELYFNSLAFGRIILSRPVAKIFPLKITHVNMHTCTQNDEMHQIRFYIHTIIIHIINEYYYVHMHSRRTATYVKMSYSRLRKCSGVSQSR